mmetsp:Transcript_47949/g.89394  ORF Transcript_47949/g.89394 Transcript_47949/m.89394 type:complete len:285 (-) Transcript_47949:102-956(-)
MSTLWKLGHRCCLQNPKYALSTRSLSAKMGTQLMGTRAFLMLILSAGVSTRSRPALIVPIQVVGTSPAMLLSERAIRLSFHCAVHPPVDGFRFSSTGKWKHASTRLRPCMMFARGVSLPASKVAASCLKRSATRSASSLARSCSVSKELLPSSEVWDVLVMLLVELKLCPPTLPKLAFCTNCSSWLSPNSSSITISSSTAFTVLVTPSHRWIFPPLNTAYSYVCSVPRGTRIGFSVRHTGYSVGVVKRGTALAWLFPPMTNDEPDAFTVWPCSVWATTKRCSLQ